MIDPAPNFGHPGADLALVDYFQQVPDEVFHAYLAVVAVDGGGLFGHRCLDRIAGAVRSYR